MSEDVDEADYAAASEELLRKTTVIQTTIEALLESGDEGAILRRLDDFEQRLTAVRVNSAAVKTGKTETHHKKVPDLTMSERKKKITSRMTTTRQEFKLDQCQQTNWAYIRNVKKRMQQHLCDLETNTCTTRYEFGAQHFERARKNAIQSGKGRNVKENIGKLKTSMKICSTKLELLKKEMEMAKASISCSSSLRRISPIC